MHQLNLLSKESLGANPELTIEAVVRAAMPGMKKPRRIEDYLRSGVIRRTHFCAAAEIRVSESVRNERQTIIETVGLSFLRYRELLGTPTPVPPTSRIHGGGRAILGWHTLCHVRAEPGSIRGVVTGEDLARLLPQPRIDAVRRDLVAWDIDLFESTRDAESG